MIFRDPYNCPLFPILSTIEFQSSDRSFSYFDFPQINPMQIGTIIKGILS